MPRFQKIPRAAAAGVAALLAAACGDDLVVDARTGPALSTVSGERTGSGIQQKVTLSPTRLATGDTVTIRSVLVNRGSATAQIEHVVCGLDYGTNTVLQNPFILCAAYSAQAALAPGDSVVQLDRRVVGAGPGAYTVRIQHLVQPTGLFVDLPLTVVSR